MSVAIHHHSSATGADELRREVLAHGGHAACFAADLSDPAAAVEIRIGAGRAVHGDFGRGRALVEAARQQAIVSGLQRAAADTQPRGDREPRKGLSSRKVGQDDSSPA